MNWVFLRCLIGLILFCLCVTHVGAAVRIAEFCPDPYLHDDADEYIVLSGTGALDGITVSDGNGGFRFPSGVKIDGSLTVARSGKAFEQSHGTLPDFEWLDTSPGIPDVISGHTLRMANTRGALMLYDNGNLVQKISWPGDVKPREGQVHFLKNGRWDPRPLMVGQSRFSPAVFRNVSVTAFVSPDCSDGLFAYVVNNATNEILLNVYEFSSPVMGVALIAAHQPGG